MLKQLALAAVASAVLAGPVLAQTAPTSNTGQFITQEKAGQWRASKLRGLNVYNNNNEKIGDINELLVDSTGKVQAVVIGVGGFLGMGEHLVAVPFDKVKFSNEPVSTGTASNSNMGNTAPAGNRPAGSTTGAAPTTSSSTATTSNTASGSSSSNSSKWYPDHAVFNASKDELKSMPEFKYSE